MFYKRGRNLILTAAVFLGLGVYLFNFGSYPRIKALSGGMDLPEEKFGYSADYFYAFLNGIGEVGRADYFLFQFQDTLNALLLTLTIFGSIYYLLYKIDGNKMLKFILVFPVLQLIFEILENSAIAYAVSNYGSDLQITLRIASFLTFAKLIFGIGSFLSLTGCLVVFVKRIIGSKLSK